MKLLPYDRFDYRSELAPAEALRRLGDAIAPRRWFRPFWGADTPPFQGQLTGNAFECERIITYRNSPSPRLRGVIEPHPLGGSRIRGTITLFPFALVFLAIWNGGFGLAGIGLVVAFARGTTPAPLFLAPFGMILFGWLLNTLSFFSEAKKVRAVLQERLAARPAVPDELGFQ